ncbi:MAG: hypothetical protein J6B92_04595 [Paraprevotella sp.]|nr:hypothetical protein [Paraprevotella sp.]MBP3472047.1 hypothetical protein [Paraprevotella sp.]
MKNEYHAPAMWVMEIETEEEYLITMSNGGDDAGEAVPESLPSDNGNGSWGSSNSLWDEEW